MSKNQAPDPAPALPADVLSAFNAWRPNCQFLVRYDDALLGFQAGASWARSQAPEGGDLPPLPEPVALGMDFERGWDGERAYGYTEEHMEAYARAALAAPAPQAPAWQPIETLPDDTLAILYGAKRSEMVIGMRHSRDGWVIDTPSEWASMYTPKLWMPLPAAPQTKEPTNDR